MKFCSFDLPRRRKLLTSKHKIASDALHQNFIFFFAILDAPVIGGVQPISFVAPFALLSIEFRTIVTIGWNAIKTFACDQSARLLVCQKITTVARIALNRMLRWALLAPKRMTILAGTLLRDKSTFIMIFELRKG